MSQELTVQEKKQIQVNDFRKELATQTKAIKAMLPSHIDVDRFQRAAVTAIGHNPDLLNADRQSVFNALIRCASDGLLPDNREGALVIFNSKVKIDGKDVWIKKAQYMPMVYGIIKRMRNGGEISTVEAHVVYRNDEFEFELGDTPRLFHKPLIEGNRGAQVFVYCIVTFRDGVKYREIMSVNEIEKARKASKTGNKGPWVDWWDEMAKKTVIHRAAKRLPSSAELDEMMAYDMKVTLNPASIEDEPNEKSPRENKIIENVEDAEIIKDESTGD